MGGGCPLPMPGSSALVIRPEAAVPVRYRQHQDGACLLCQGLTWAGGCGPVLLKKGGRPR